MRKVFILLIPMLLLVACGNTDDLEEVIAEQDEEIMELQKEIDSLENEVVDLEYQLSNNELEVSQTEMGEAEDELHLKMFNNILVDYQEEYKDFDVDVAVSLYNAISEAEELIGMKDIIIGNLDENHQEMYGDFFDDVIELEESFE